MPDITPAETARAVSMTSTAGAVEVTRTSTHDPFAERRWTAHRLEQAIYLVFGVVEALIAVRFVLKLLGAGAEAGFAQFVYGTTAPLLLPFAGLFGTPQAGGSSLELVALAALAVYALVGWLIARLARLFVGETRAGLVTRRETRSQLP